MLEVPLEVVDGYIIIPDAPGIGIELAEDIEERFPPEYRDIPLIKHYDGFIKDR